ncbi:tRNA-(ms[2]io[6]A)-hydroxylase [Bermanella sp. R86510]|uniref:tRNA-(ms[2]io[6]A)-hydroxylase n=1 Tax=unclassified Bermanella TaxID=2627862 RepID=UPI0037C7575B
MAQTLEELMQPVLDYLLCETPDQWLEAALQFPETILIDHAANELKAAQSAMTLMSKNPHKIDVLNKMSRLAREELVHFEQVMKILKNRGIKYQALKASPYAGKMAKFIRNTNEEILVDSLIIGSIIEARSCERFYKISSHLDAELEKFYLSLLKSEARHFTDYLGLAQKYSKTPIDDRIQFFLEKERDAIMLPDNLMRLHSGMPTDNMRI